MTIKSQPHAAKVTAAAPNRPPLTSAVPAAAVDPDAAAARASTVRQHKALQARTAAADPKTQPRPKAGGPARQATPPAPAAPKPAPVRVNKKAAKQRPVLVRDSFTMPEADFALIARLKATALKGQRAAKKSELLRAGLQLLAGLDAESLVVVLNRLIAVKTGRPKKGH